jgi:hypothetical protein
MIPQPSLLLGASNPWRSIVYIKSPFVNVVHNFDQRMTVNCSRRNVSSNVQIASTSSWYCSSMNRRSASWFWMSFNTSSMVIGDGCCIFLWYAVFGCKKCVTGTLVCTSQSIGKNNFIDSQSMVFNFYSAYLFIWLAGYTTDVTVDALKFRNLHFKRHCSFYFDDSVRGVCGSTTNDGQSGTFIVRVHAATTTKTNTTTNPTLQQKRNNNNDHCDMLFLTR